jgi:hypothetical protein
VDDGEIVVKDKNGGYKLDIPVLPPIVGEDGEEMEGMESGGAGNSATANNEADSGQGGMSGREKESKFWPSFDYGLLVSQARQFVLTVGLLCRNGSEPG